MDNDLDHKSSWFDALFSSRAALRGISIVTMFGALYAAIGSLCQSHIVNAATAAADIQSALWCTFAINAILILFACFHGLLPVDAGELRARFSGRGIMRYLSITASGACFLIGQYAAWKTGDAFLAWEAEGAMVVSWLLFAVVYGVYAKRVHSDRIASKCSINKSGTGRQSLVFMAGMTAVGGIFIGLSTGMALSLLYSLVFVCVLMTIFTATMLFFETAVDITDDRG